MSTDNTTPQPRVNKLGHVVTKHVLTSPATPPLKATLPAPVAPVQTASAEARDAKIKRLVTGINAGRLFGKDSDAEVRDALNAFSDSTLDLISYTAGWHRSKGLPRIRFMYSVLTLVTEEDKERTVREIMSMVTLFRDDLNTDEMLRIINGLHHVGQFDGKHLDALTEDERQLAEELTNLTATIYIRIGSSALGTTDDGDGDPTLHLRKDLADLIARYPGQVESIQGFIIDRESTDAELIREYLQIGALGEGVL